MPSLYELSNELAAILHGEDDELSDDLASRLEALEVAFEAKVEGVLQYRQGLLADAQGLAMEVQRLEERKDALTKKAEWLKQYVHNAMLQLNVGKVSTKTFTATVAKSPLKVNLEDGVEPVEYLRIKEVVSVDKEAILEDFKLGKTLPVGVSVTQSTNLRIK